jgi:hypothetical protein
MVKIGNALRSEIEKAADMMIGKGQSVAGGLFVSADTPEDSKSRALEAQSLIKKHHGLQAAAKELREKYKDAYVTVAVKKEEEPHGFLKNIFQHNKLKAEKDSYADRVKNPRIFVRSGPAGEYHQHAMYNEVARGYYDNELRDAPIPKKNKVVYM